ncbi:MAG: hypothetical protein IJ214_05695, partial [Clostridia bacterium]|nr:hypothetical protein [Clostridia bacterium]
IFNRWFVCCPLFYNSLFQTFLPREESAYPSPSNPIFSGWPEVTVKRISNKGYGKYQQYRVLQAVVVKSALNLEKAALLRYNSKRYGSPRYSIPRWMAVKRAFILKRG